jgi:hypothetical protein
MALLAVATDVSGVIGRVIYQGSLAVTDNDNGFVSMSFLLIPAFTCLLSLAMSPWIKGLEFRWGALFYAGPILVAVVLFFSWRSWRAMNGDAETAKAKPDGSVSAVTSSAA